MRLIMILALLLAAGCAAVPERYDRECLHSNVYERKSTTEYELIYYPCRIIRWENPKETP